MSRSASEVKNQEERDEYGNCRYKLAQQHEIDAALAHLDLAISNPYAPSEPNMMDIAVVMDAIISELKK